MYNYRFITLTILLFFSAAFSYCQPKMVYPGRGIEGVPIIIDSSTIRDVFRVYGEDYIKKEKYSRTLYFYDKFGLTFEINSYNKNQVICGIFAEYPFEAQSEGGIILNKSTFREARIYSNNNISNTDGGFTYFDSKNIYYYVKRDTCLKCEFDPNSIICKIGTISKNHQSFDSGTKFLFNEEPYKKKLSELISILQSPVCDTNKINEYIKKEKSGEDKPYSIRFYFETKRALERGLVQQSMELWFLNEAYKLNLVSIDNKVAFAKLNRISNKDSVLYERADVNKFQSLLKYPGNNTTESKSISPIDFPIESYIYGDFCGIAGMPQKECVYLLKLVTRNNYGEISRWLHSLNPEIAAYGYVGMEFMRKRGFPVKSSDKSRMTDVIRSDVLLNICEGCIIGRVKRPNELLGRKMLNWDYKEFKKCGWLYFPRPNIHSSRY